MSTTREIEAATATRARRALALVRMRIGAMFVWVFFGNYGKGLYNPKGYADLIEVYVTPGAAPAAFVFLTSLRVSEWGTAWIGELLVPMGAALAVALGAAGRTWGLDAVLARRNPSAPWW